MHFFCGMALQALWLQKKSIFIYFQFSVILFPLEKKYKPVCSVALNIYMVALFCSGSRITSALNETLALYKGTIP